MHVAVASAVATAVRGGDRDRVVDCNHSTRTAVSASDAHDHCASIVATSIHRDVGAERVSCLPPVHACNEAKDLAICQ
jgi:hypothetical protein